MQLSLPIYACVPFVLLLLCIATFPLIPKVKDKWQSHLVQLAIACILGFPVAAFMCLKSTPWSVVHALVEYVQFISLLVALYVVSGGIFVGGDLRATPKVNVILLGIGALLSSFIGTTGAAMLLVRPILRTNQQRQFKVHTLVFAIFLVANSGGLLTPLGDPPLFLGMLRGVPFTWTFGLFPEWLALNGLLLLTFWALDRQAYAMESEEALKSDVAQVDPIRIEGKSQILAFLAIIASVACLPSCDLSALLNGTGTWLSAIPCRELAMLTIAALSYALGSRDVRFGRNAFTWGPILEVACLFVGIFLTMIPALTILGELAPTLSLSPLSMMALTGSLSSFLDNAPTYATFFEMASELHLAGADVVAGVPVPYLIAVSLGAVFGGAITYIGNGPNFMVKAVAESFGVSMPTFGGYILKWSFRFYVPALVSVALIFLSPTRELRFLGVALFFTLALKTLVSGGRQRRPLVGPDGDGSTPKKSSKRPADQGKALEGRAGEAGSDA